MDRKYYNGDMKSEDKVIGARLLVNDRVISDKQRIKHVHKLRRTQLYFNCNSYDYAA